MAPEHPEPLVLQITRSGPRYHLHGRPLFGGDVVQLCFSGGWVMGRFEWSQDPEEPARFHTSIELAGGGVEAIALEIHQRALFRREA